MIIENTNTSALLIFIKNAELGKVKTRLASTLGDEMALKIYLSLLSHTRHIATEIKANRFLFYSDFINQEDDWKADDFQKHLQHDGDLGDRIKSAFELAFQSNSKVVIIGSDCASLNAEIVEEAFMALNSSPFVIGPAMDGGYYLIGMNKFEPAIFENIDWSTDKVLRQTIETIKKLNKSCYILPELSDIDYEEDWKEYGWKI